jgi:transposase
MGRIRLKRLIEEKFGNRYSEYKISRYLIDLGITTRLRNNKRSLPETERVKEEGLINLL